MCAPRAASSAQTLVGHGGFTSDSWLVCAMMSFVLTGYCRAFTPRTLRVPGFDDPVYLNINMGHEFFRDIKSTFLHAADGAAWYVYLPYLLAVGTSVLHGVPFALIRGGLALAGLQ